jgi:hypoxanthine phosphoribosyltransferase
MDKKPLPEGAYAAAGDLRILFSAAEIAARVETLAAEIARTIPGDFVVVGLLKGAALFTADLVRALHRAGERPEIEFMRLASYGLGKESSRQVQVLGPVPSEVARRRVLLVDDIVDTGRSIVTAVTLLRELPVAALWTCALLEKPMRREVEVKIDFVGFSIGDVFVAGYGTDYAERYRYLPYIGVVE